MATDHTDASDSRPLEPEIMLYDTTLRDGAQAKGISYSLNDKLAIVELLSEFGIPYIEGGWPGSNPKDAEFFRRVRHRSSLSTRIAAFGSTRRRGVRAADDLNIQALVAAETPVVTIVGKSWTLHVERVIETSRQENLAMIEESVEYLRRHGREVIYDAEHFFDGFRADSPYALATLRAAVAGGSSWIVLCDTNGGSLPEEIGAITEEVMREVILPAQREGRSVSLGIHTHNDSELAVANALAAVRAGARQIQGTINGYGERCGNANLVSIIPTLELKMKMRCLPRGALVGLSSLSKQVSEIANLAPDSKAPYVGSSAFAHKGGIHVAAVEKLAESYEHISPALVGNQREIVISELSGRGNVRVRATELGLPTHGVEGAVLEEIKNLEAKGYSFENADASFKLLLRRAGSNYVPPFVVREVVVISQQGLSGIHGVQAMVKVQVDETILHTVADGSGPVHALDAALRKALTGSFPWLESVRLTDYKVRILDPEQAAGAVTRVTIEAAAGGAVWTTVGCSPNIIDASLQALVDSLHYAITDERSNLEEAHLAVGC